MVKLDIDLCDERGHICVEMRGISWQQMALGIYPEMEESAGSAPAAAVEAAASRTEDSDVLSGVLISLKTLLANELQMRERDVDEAVPFVDLGLDSISGVTWVRKINEKYRTTIGATKVYGYPTLNELSRYVKEEAEKYGTLSSRGRLAAEEMPVAPGQSPGSEPGAEKLTSWRRRTALRLSRDPARPVAQPIAVIGMAGRFPQAHNLQEFWENIAHGKNCITQVPPRSLGCECLLSIWRRYCRARARPTASG